MKFHTKVFLTICFIALVANCNAAPVEDVNIGAINNNGITGNNGQVNQKTDQPINIIFDGIRPEGEVSLDEVKQDQEANHPIKITFDGVKQEKDGFKKLSGRRVCITITICFEVKL